MRLRNKQKKERKIKKKKRWPQSQRRHRSAATRLVTRSADRAGGAGGGGQRPSFLHPLGHDLHAAMPVAPKSVALAGAGDRPRAICTPHVRRLGARFRGNAPYGPRGEGDARPISIADFPWWAGLLCCAGA